MRDFAEALAHARDGAPFSNGFEWDHWSANWCLRCVNDKDESCPLVAVVMIEGKTPSEWLEQDRNRLGDQYHCIEFRDEDNPGPSEPQPIPDPPGQLLLLPREPYEGARMLSARHVEVPL